MHTIRLKDDYIKLGQALKAAGVVESGVDAKFAVQDGLVKVNGQTETQRGKKLVSGDKVEYDGETIVITGIMIRSSCSSTVEPIFCTETMRRARRISWKQSMLLPPQNRIKEARTEKLLILTRKRHILERISKKMEKRSAWTCI